MFCLALLSFGLNGCSSLVKELQPPTVELSGLQVLTTELNRQSFRVSLDVTNPNPLPVPIDGIRYNINVGGGPLANGETEDSFTLPANGTERVRLDVSTDLLGTLGRISDLLKGASSAVDYEINGDFKVPLMDPIPFSQKGEVALAIP